MAIDDALDPVLRMVARSVAEPGPEVRERLAAQTVSLVLMTASEFIGPDRSRACWYRLDAGPPGRLVPVEHAGRAGPPTTHVVEGSIAGDAAIDLVLTDGALRCEDVLSAPPPTACSPSTRSTPAPSAPTTRACSGWSPGCSPWRWAWPSGPGSRRHPPGAGPVDRRAAHGETRGRGTRWP